jgi:hypothetical protein
MGGGGWWVGVVGGGDGDIGEGGDMLVYYTYIHICTITYIHTSRYPEVLLIRDTMPPS